MTLQKFLGLSLLLLWNLFASGQKHIIQNRNLSLAQAIAVKSEKIQETQLAALLSKEAFELHQSSKGKMYDPYIFTSLYKATKRLEEKQGNPQFNILDQVPLGYPRMGAIRGICIDAQDNMYTTGSDGTLLKWKLISYQSQAERLKREYIPQLLSQQKKVFRAISLSPDGKILARGGDADNVEIFDNASQKILAQANPHHNRRVWAIEFMPNGKGFISSGDDGSIQYCNLKGESKPFLEKLPDEITRLTSIAISANGRYLIGIGNSAYLWIWDMKTGETLKKLAAQSDIEADLETTAVAIGGAKDRFITVGYQDGSLRVWDLEALQGNRLLVPKKLKYHSASITDIDFNFDGSMMAVGSFDKKATLWQIREDAENETHYPYKKDTYLPIELTDHQHWVMAVRFSGDGSKLVAGCADGKLRVWQTDSRVYANRICELVQANLRDLQWERHIGTDDPKGERMYIQTINGQARTPQSTCLTEEGKPCSPLLEDN